MKSVAPNCRATASFAGVGVDDDDAAGGRDARGLDDRLADAAGADDDDGLARLHLGPVEHRAGARDDRAADEARDCRAAHGRR